MKNITMPYEEYLRLKKDAESRKRIIINMEIKRDINDWCMYQPYISLRIEPENDRKLKSFCDELESWLRFYVADFEEKKKEYIEYLNENKSEFEKVKKTLTYNILHAIGLL